MTTRRFDYQREAVEDAVAGGSEWMILNVGANSDPAELKQRYSAATGKILNCDLFAHDQVIDSANNVDVLFDAARDRWPFDDRVAALVVLGDILEHMNQAEIDATLKEARRVSTRLCITVPSDDRDEVNDERADTYPRGAVHRTTVTENALLHALDRTGWKVTDWQTVEYDSGAFWGKRVLGFFVTAV